MEYKDLTIEYIQETMYKLFHTPPPNTGRRMVLYFTEANMERFNEAIKEQFRNSAKKMKHYHRKTKKKKYGDIY